MNKSPPQSKKSQQKLSQLRFSDPLEPDPVASDPSASEAIKLFRSKALPLFSWVTKYYNAFKQKHEGILPSDKFIDVTFECFIEKCETKLDEIDNLLKLVNVPASDIHLIRDWTNERRAERQDMIEEMRSLLREESQFEVESNRSLASSASSSARVRQQERLAKLQAKKKHQAKADEFARKELFAKEQEINMEAERRHQELNIQAERRKRELEMNIERQALIDAQELDEVELLGQIQEEGEKLGLNSSNLKVNQLQGLELFMDEVDDRIHSRTSLDYGANFSANVPPRTLTLQAHEVDTRTTVTPPMQHSFTQVNSRPVTSMLDPNYSSRTQQLRSDVHRQPTHPTVASSTVNMNNPLIPVMAGLSESIRCTSDSNFLANFIMPIFDGEDVTKYVSFIHDFKTSIEPRCPNPDICYSELRRRTSGRARDIVENQQFAHPNVKYSNAIRDLNEEFGNPTKIEQLLLFKLKSWPSIPDNKAKPILEYTNFLIKCLSYMDSSGGSLSNLNNHSDIHDVIGKLPYRLVSRYRSLVVQNDSRGVSLTFRDAVSFVKTISKEWNHPYYDAPVSRLRDNRYERPNNNYKKNFAITSRFNSNSNMNARQQISSGTVTFSSTGPCSYCKGAHFGISVCSKFNDLGLKEKNDYVRDKKLCLNCLSNKHFRRDCKNLKRCKMCNEDHHTFLHSETPKYVIRSTNTNLQSSPENHEAVSLIQKSTNEDFDSSNYRVMSTSKKLSSLKVIGPSVAIKIKARNGNYISTYMSLDTQSSDCWINNKLLDELQHRTTEAVIDVTTMSDFGKSLKIRLVKNLTVTDMGGRNHVEIPYLYGRDDWPFSSSDLATQEELNNFDHLKSIPILTSNAKEIGILLGNNVPALMTPLKTIKGNNNEPVAVKYKHGWTVCGPVGTSSEEEKSNCHRTSIGVDPFEPESDIWNKLQEVFAADFVDSADDKPGMSVQDTKWYQIVRRSIKKLPSQHYQIDLPLRDPTIRMANNREQVRGIFKNLQRKLNRDPEQSSEYVAFMWMMLDKGFIERIPSEDLTPNHNIWYLPHHGVKHKVKRKLRIVFNSSLKYNGLSLNDHLLQGPDLTNSLMGVLLRFRQHPFALSADLEKMFFQVKVPRVHADLMRFFWVSDEDFSGEPVEYRLLVHVFGNISSPSIANFALRQTVIDHEPSLPEIKDLVDNHFYVDDLLFSKSSEKEICDLRVQVSDVVMEGGFNLTGYCSNSLTVLNTIDPMKRTKKLLNLELLCSSDLPDDSALGMKWNIQSDFIGYNLKSSLEDSVVTRRSMLSLMHSFYDPLGLAGPAILKAKQLFQESCHSEKKLQWDDPVSPKLSTEWRDWKTSIVDLLKYEVPRSYSPPGKIISRQLHFFCDGSEIAYGAIAYMRTTMESEVVVVPVMAKGRLVPCDRKSLKTIPRIELNAAKLAVQVSKTLHSELQGEFEDDVFWSDSTVVIQYINNEERAFHTFVHHRLVYIRNYSTKEQWRHIPGALNPADVISRGLTAHKLLSCNLWNHGPEFLLASQDQWPMNHVNAVFNEKDPEVKKIKILQVHRSSDPSRHLLESTSSWRVMCVRVEIFHKFSLFLRSKFRSDVMFSRELTMENRNSAIRCLLKFSQQQYFKEEIHKLRTVTEKRYARRHPLIRLSPILDEFGLLRVGGRLERIKETSIERRSLLRNVKHPIILSPKSYIVKILCMNVHSTNAHAGRTLLISLLRENYWIVRSHGLIRKIIHDCVICRRALEKPQVPFMSELPEERINPSLPFENTGTDFFGPFTVHQFRRTMKSYGVLFTCMASRAIHIEVTSELSTDSFLCALRRFIARRGNIKSIWSDNGTNYVGADKELTRCIEEWNSKTIEEDLKQRNIKWIFNPPHAPHFGGIWEREVSSIKRTLNFFRQENLMKMTSEGLRTWLCEVESLLNNRPLTALSDSPHDFEALTPNHLLLGRSNQLLPPGFFEKSDTYSKKRWRAIQHLVNRFWKRWNAEYLQILQLRHRWTNPTRQVLLGDLVLVIDKLLPRNLWNLARVIERIPSADGVVRRVRLRVARGRFQRNRNISDRVNLSNNSSPVSELERPVSNIILLLPFDTPDLSND